MSCTRLMRFLLGLVCLWGIPLAFSQDKKEDNVNVERVIYIPYQQLEKLIQKTETGIYLPYKDYKNLLEELERLRQKPADVPTTVLISNALYQSRVVDDFLEVASSYTLNILDKGWYGLVLGFKNVAIKEALLDSKPALLRWKDGNYELFVESSEPGKKQLEVSFVVPLIKSQGLGASTTFNVPRAPIARLLLEIPVKEDEQASRLKVDIYPSLLTRQSVAPGVAKLETLLGNTEEIRIQWESQAERKVEIKQILHAENASRLEVGENFLQVHAKIRYDLIQGDINKLQLKLPTGFRVLLVNPLQGIGIRDWAVEEQDNLLVVNLLEKIPERGENKVDAELEVKLEKVFSETEKKFNIPSLEVLGVERERGFYTILVNELHTLKMLQRRDIAQIDLNELPPYVDRQHIQFAFKYLKRPFSLEVELEKIEAEYEVLTNIAAYLDDTMFRLYGNLQYQVKKSLIFGTKVEIPQDFLLLEVKAYNLEKAEEQYRDQIKEYREFEEEVEKEKKRFLALTFNKGIRSEKLALRIRMQKKLPEEKVREFSLPVLRAEGAKRDTGNIGIGVHPSFNITTIEKSQRNLFPLDVRELFLQGDKPPSQPIPVNIGLRYFDHPVASRFKVEKRDPLVTAEVYHYVNTEDTMVKHQFHILYTVKYTGVKEFCFSLPADIAKEVPTSRISETKNKWIKEIRTTEQKEDNRVLYTIVTQRDVLHKDNEEPYEIQVSYDNKIGQIETSKQISMFELITHNTKQEHGFIVFKKNNNFSLDFVALKGLDATDIHDPNFKQPSKEGILAIFKYPAHGYQLTMRLQKLQFEPVLNTLVHRLHINTTLNNDLTSKNEAVVLLINNRKQMLDFEVPEGSTVTSVARLKQMPPRAYYGNRYRRDELVNYMEDLKWFQGDQKNRFRVNIATNVQKNAPFVLIINYDTKISQNGMGYRGKFLTNAITFTDVPVTYFTWDLGLPTEYQYVRFKSNLVRQFTYEYGIWNPLVDLFAIGQVDTSIIKPDAETGVIPIYDLQGKVFSFSRLAGGGYIQVSYCDLYWLRTWKLLIFLLICGLLVGIPRLLKISRLSVFLVMLVFSAFLTSLNLQGYEDLYLTMLWSTFLVGTTAAVISFGKFLGAKLAQGVSPKAGHIIRDTQSSKKEAATKSEEPAKPDGSNKKSKDDSSAEGNEHRPVE